jgi:hypothetical protein
MRGRQQEHEAEAKVDEVGRLGLDDDLLREVRTIVNGYANAARIEIPAVDPDSLHDRGSLELLRDEAARAENSFLTGAGQQVDEIIEDLARRNSGWFVRGWYELLFLGLTGFILFLIGKNFFYESFWLGERPLEADFYIAAGIIFLLWTGLLVILFSRRLRRGLDRRIEGLAESLSTAKLARGPFPELDAATERIDRCVEQYNALLLDAAELRNEVLTSEKLGARLTRAQPIRRPSAIPQPIT